MSTTPTLRGDGIVLRPLVLEDAPALFAALGDPQVQRYRRQEAHADVAETERYIADTLNRSRAAWAITQDGGEALGRLALREPDPGDGEFGIVIRRDIHGKGLGTKALALAEAYAFNDLAFTTLRASIDSENRASLALFAKCGFVRTTTLVADRMTKLGSRDSVIVEKKCDAS